MIKLYTKGNLPAAWMEYLTDNSLRTDQNIILFYEDTHHTTTGLVKWLNTHTTEDYTMSDISENFLLYFIPDDLAALLKLHNCYYQSPL